MIISRLTIHKNYDRSLKQRAVIFSAMALVGVVGMLCYLLLVPGSHLSDHARGFYLGAATGLTTAGLGLLLRVLFLLTHPKAKRRAQVEETDERQVLITNEAAKIAGLTTFFLAAGALFVVLPLWPQAYAALLAVLAVYGVTFFGANLWLGKKL